MKSVKHAERENILCVSQLQLQIYYVINKKTTIRLEIGTTTRWTYSSSIL